MIFLGPGARVGRLVLVSLSSKRYFGSRLWVCVCECGKKITRPADRLRNGKTRSCGCLRRETTRRNKTIHGNAPKIGRKTRAYYAWNSMMDRCYRVKSDFYNRYGKRGIKVCERWHEAKNFLSDMGPCPGRLTLERKNNNGNYEPSNCRWATMSDQARNRSSNRLLTFSGKTQPLIVWGEEVGLKPATIAARIRRGWSIERSLTEKLMEAVII